LPSTSAAAAQTPQQSVEVKQAPPAQAPVAGGQQEQAPIADAQQQQPQGGNSKVSGAPLMDNKRLLHSEERVEYRDQDGNLLNEEQVKALEGKVEFKTRYETRTRVVDAQGNEILLPPGEQPQQAQEQEPAAPAGVAPPHPDVEGANSETAKRVVPDEPIPEPKKSVEGEKEREEKAAKPASEKNEASAKVEL